MKKSKICKSCNIYKSSDEFYHHKGVCKECLIKNNKSWVQNNKKKVKEYQKQWELKNKDKRNLQKKKYIKEKRKNDNLFKLRGGVSRLIRMSILRSGYKKSSKTQEILGCSFDEFKVYLESKFESWMSWDNRGLYNGNFNFGWDIDHIIPISSATSEEEILKLNHYTNLQPLCSYINRDIKR